MAVIEIKNVAKRFGEYQALHDINLTIADQELNATHRLDVLNVHVKLFENPMNGNKVMARTRIC